MPKVSFYLRNEDIDKWKALENKSEAIHHALNQVWVSADFINEVAHQPVKTAKKVKDVLAVLNEPEEVLEAVKERVTDSKVCKIHGTPMDYRGRCLLKGCRYA